MPALGNVVGENGSALAMVAQSHKGQRARGRGRKPENLRTAWATTQLTKTKTLKWGRELRR